MEIRNCKRCKKIFQYLNGPVLCPSCRDEDEQMFQKVKEYLKENPRSTMTEVAEALDISIERITRYLREGRLEIAPNSPIKLDCERCGAPITTGRFCNTCSGKLGGDLESTSRELKEKISRTPESLMKYLKRDK